MHSKVGTHSWPSPSVCSPWFASTSRLGRRDSEVPLLGILDTALLKYSYAEFLTVLCVLDLFTH